ncbi:MAG: glycosyltransferase family 4 protein, partial [Pseudomonadota bacterium]
MQMPDIRNRLKIGLVCPYDILRAGGVQEHALAQAEELRKRGHTVKILTPRPRGVRGDAPEGVIFVGNSANIKVLTKTTMEVGINIDNSLLDEILSKEKFDLLHIHEPEVPILGAQIIARAKCPIVGTFHAVNPNTPMARTLEGLRMPFSRTLFNKLTAMTAVSDAAAGFVREHMSK